MAGEQHKHECCLAFLVGRATRMGQTHCFADNVDLGVTLDFSNGQNTRAKIAEAIGCEDERAVEDAGDWRLQGPVDLRGRH